MPTIKTKNINAKNPFENICLFSKIFSNLFYTCLINIVALMLIILWINNKIFSITPSNVKILFYFYIINLITLTLNNNNIMNNIKQQYNNDIDII
jgi:hypothetical protein